MVMATTIHRTRSGRATLSRMPPRYAYWTILIDGKPTAFRARDREELLPTLAQLRRTSPQTEMRWFASGRLWDSPEQAQWARKHASVSRERRDRDWRPGGAHKDPRAKFDKARGAKGPRRQRPPGARSAGSAPSGSRPPGTSRPPSRPPASRPHGSPPGSRPPGRPPGSRPGGHRTSTRPPGGRPTGSDRGPRGPRRRR